MPSLCDADFLPLPGSPSSHGEHHLPGSGTSIHRTLQVETWKPVPIPGFEKTHEVSDHGRVRTVSGTRHNKKGQPYHYTGRVLKLDAHTSGYPSVKLRGGGKRKHVCVHRLVALAFLGSPPGPVGVRHGEWSVNHIDGDKTNNFLTNLEWTQENREHAKEIGLIRSGEEHPRAKLTDAEVEAIRSEIEAGHYTRKELATIYDISVGYVGVLVRGEARKQAA